MFFKKSKSYHQILKSNICCTRKQFLRLVVFTCFYYDLKSVDCIVHFDMRFVILHHDLVFTITFCAFFKFIQILFKFNELQQLFFPNCNILIIRRTNIQTFVQIVPSTHNYRYNHQRPATVSNRYY